ncbi:uncharacterized protein LOC130733138 isoform X2 [Lotus japonicus]|uniref:uncharacterized protein LOC130733138 isoform X2 n=1 Tax=Lotus japonicus TaxID=34305 RepID=UPI00258654CD|nr:uncharacterized protein LOC130733138 isoform X2 [Lotus japonicus]
MAATSSSASASGIVLEPLTIDNYDNWSRLVRNYLMGQDLWKIAMFPNMDVKSKEEYENWERINAMALHIIQLACGSQNLTHIRDVETAKMAWSKLNVLYTSKLKADSDIPQGIAEDNLGDYKKLHMHVLSGEWEDAESFIYTKRQAIYSKSSWDRTVLHTAVIAGHGKIVKELVKIGKDRLVNIQDKNGYTALALAAEQAGNIEIAKYIIRGAIDQPRLLTVKTEAGEIPVLRAAAKSHQKMTTYLYTRTPFQQFQDANSHNGSLLLTRCITAEVFDVALDLLLRTKVPLALDAESQDLQPLYALACVPSAFKSGCGYGLLQRGIYNILIVQFNHEEDDDADATIKVVVSQVAPEEEDQRKSSFTGRILLPVYMLVQKSLLIMLPGMRKIYDQKKNHLIVREILRILQKRIRDPEEFNNTQLQDASGYDAMLQAAKLGIIEFIDIMSKANPNLLWAIDQNKIGIFTHAVMNRKKEVFYRIQDAKVNGRKDIINGRPDASGNTILHMAAYLGPSSDLDNILGPALQMQREIQWFKEVERNVNPRCKEAKNAEDKKPIEVFNENHKELVKAGEKWAKEIAGHFTIVGTLIMTIMFAAAFTIPGGNNHNDKILTAFIISDAVSLFTSSASVLLFIGILTSRYAVNDFHKSLPWKLFFGLLFLFLSVFSMIVAFCSSLAMYRKGHQLVKIAAISVSCVPVYVLLQSLGLFIEIFKSTIRSELVHLFSPPPLWKNKKRDEKND